MARDTKTLSLLPTAPAPKKRAKPAAPKKRKPAKAKATPAPKREVDAGFDTREQWLMAGMDALRPLFAAHGYDVPAQVRVSCGWPGGGSARKRIGEAWSPKAASDGVAQIFISPTLDDAVRVLDVLAHEMVHVTVGNEAGHGKVFRACATAIGLTGKMTATVAGPELETKLAGIAQRLGAYPNAKLNLGSRKKQTTRMVKLQCPDPQCECGGYSVRTTRKWLDVGMPSCPMGTEMELA